MACLCPRNSISNVVASVTIHDERNIHFNETIVEGHKHIHIYIYIYIYTCMYIYIYIYMCLWCVCLCVGVCDRVGVLCVLEGEEGGCGGGGGDGGWVLRSVPHDSL